MDLVRGVLAELKYIISLRSCTEDRSRRIGRGWMKARDDILYDDENAEVGSGVRAVVVSSGEHCSIEANGRLGRVLNGLKIPEGIF
jgi:hypothetical protein